MRMTSVCLLVCLLGRSGILAQSTVNSDISLVGDFRTYTHNDRSRPDEREKLNLATPEIELSVNGYLNPYVRADAVLGWHEGSNAELEEAYASVLRGFPFGMNLRVGKYLLEFGRLNPVHEHAYSFLKRPLPHAKIFGEHGLSDMAVRASVLLPTGAAYTELMGGLLRGDAMVGGHHHDESGLENDQHDSAEEEQHRPGLGFFGRLTSSMSVSEAAELAVGGSVLNTVHEFYEDDDTSAVQESEPGSDEPIQLRAWVIGGDIKYKNKRSRYSTLQIEAETLARFAERHDGDGRLSSYGAYGYLDYRFRQRYNVGGVVEWTRIAGHETDEEGEDHAVHNHEIRRFGLFAGFAPVEETSLMRLAGHWTEPDDADGFWEVALQMVFSLGPHQPHNF